MERPEGMVAETRKHREGSRGRLITTITGRREAKNQHGATQAGRVAPEVERQKGTSCADPGLARASSGLARWSPDPIGFGPGGLRQHAFLHGGRSILCRYSVGTPLYSVVYGSLSIVRSISYIYRTRVRRPSLLQ